MPDQCLQLPSAAVPGQPDVQVDCVAGGVAPTLHHHLSMLDIYNLQRNRVCFPLLKYLIQIVEMGFFFTFGNRRLVEKEKKPLSSYNN